MASANAVSRGSPQRESSGDGKSVADLVDIEWRVQCLPETIVVNARTVARRRVSRWRPWRKD
jgi:hypothetical protein